MVDLALFDVAGIAAQQTFAGTIWREGNALEVFDHGKVIACLDSIDDENLIMRSELFASVSKPHPEEPRSPRGVSKDALGGSVPALATDPATSILRDSPGKGAQDAGGRRCEAPMRRQRAPMAAAGAMPKVCVRLSFRSGRELANFASGSSGPGGDASVSL